MKSIIRIVMISMFSLIFIAGCGDSKSSGGSVASHDINLPNGAESVVPMPKDASITVGMEDERSTSLMFKPEMNHKDTTAFFSEAFADDNWNIINENVNNDSEGKVRGFWEVEGNGVYVIVEVTAFGGVESTNVTGLMNITEQ